MSISRALAWLAFACLAVITLGLSASVASVFFREEPEVLFDGLADE